MSALSDLGISELSLSDTTGMDNPVLIETVCGHFMQKYSKMRWNLHLHNTWGMGLANVVAALQCGIVHFDTAFAGLGGCPYAPGASGNISTEDLIHMLGEMGIETGIDLKACIQTGREVADYFGHHESSMLRSGSVTDLYCRTSC